MKDLDRDEANRSIDYIAKMEEQSRHAGDFKYPALAILAISLVVGGVIWFIAAAWNSV